MGRKLPLLGSEQSTKEGNTDDLSGLVIGVIGEPTGLGIDLHAQRFMNYAVVSCGKSAHNSMPKDGINAIANTNEFVMLFAEKVINSYVYLVKIHFSRNRFENDFAVLFNVIIIHMPDKVISWQ